VDAADEVRIREAARASQLIAVFDGHSGVHDVKPFDLESKRRRVHEAVQHARTGVAGKPAGSLIDAAYAFVCGLPGEGRELAELWEKQLTGPPLQVETREPRTYYVYSEEALRVQDLELTRWLITGDVDPALNREAVACWETAVAGGRSLGPRADPMDLDAYMRNVVQAAEWARGIGFYEQEDRDALKPLALQRIQSERRLCYAICRHALRAEWGREAILDAVDRLLRRQMAHWLGEGQSPTAATWLKLRYVHLYDGGPVADVLAHALDYL
jgi:hypothetical protein